MDTPPPQSDSCETGMIALRRRKSCELSLVLGGKKKYVVMDRKWFLPVPGYLINIMAIFSQ